VAPAIEKLTPPRSRTRSACSSELGRTGGAAAGAADECLRVRDSGGNSARANEADPGDALQSLARLIRAMLHNEGRDFAAWIGLVPRQDSTGGKQKLGPISKQGDRYLRRILVVGAHSVLRRAKQSPEKYPWLTQLLARRPFKVVAIALANKMARIAWALLASGGRYRAPRLAAA
jgi:hypothetical protein